MRRHDRTRGPIRTGDRLRKTRAARDRILIVCEGKKTEPNYFRSLIELHRLHSVVLDDGTQRVAIDVEPAARGSMTLVRYAERMQQSLQPYHEIWCVFDKDEETPDDFDNAVAKTLGHAFLRAAWSNEAFELWYVLHFHYLNTSPARRGRPPREYYIVDLKKRLRKAGRSDYEKNDPAMYEWLGSERRDTALQNARKLMQQYPEGTPCHACKPATKVYELVERLLSYAPETAGETLEA